MFDLKKYYEKENEKIENSYQNSLLAIKEIYREISNLRKKHERKEYYHFFKTVGEFILELADYEKNLNDVYFSARNFEELLRKNNGFYKEIARKNYKKSYTNPSYCVSVFGDRFGQLISYFYCTYRQYINWACYHKIFKMEEYNRLFIDVYKYIKNNKPEYEPFKKLSTALAKKDKTHEIILSFKRRFSIDFRYLRDIVENTDLNDLRYLFRYGNHITNNEVKTAEFLLNYSEKKIIKLSQQIATAYIGGFKRNNKDISKKITVGLMFNIGQERIIRQLIKDLKKHNLETCIINVSSTKTNKQYEYDHRFDAALYLDKEYVDLHQKNYKEAGENCKEILSACSGMIYLDKFGESPFTPANKNESLKFTVDQQKLYQIHQNNIVMIQNKYLPRKEISFTIISFPSPEIGKNFEQIFEDILEINMLDTEQYERIQQKIIDVLDKADYVHIKGNNKTDIKVKMQEIKNPSKETNFINSGAGTNIPVGEVFTSPQLKGTSGILHIEKTHLNGLKFVDLKLTFKDGFIVDYDCNNFDKRKDNRKFIEENLLFPHKTLPMGEFAIGTNTLAYAIAKKHNIINILPVLIIEKMGPHFAIGDTCFAFNENKSVFNKFNNKEMIARENEKTALRKTKPEKAYTYQHIDITLPYESLAIIAAVTKNGKKIDIIKNGKFVLKGTEELNKPFDAIN